MFVNPVIYYFVTPPRETITSCKCFLWSAKSLSVLDFGISPHSSWQNTSSSEIFFGLLACTAQFFYNIEVWGLWWPFQSLHLSFLEVIHGWFCGMLGIIVLIEYSTSLQLQCLGWPSNISLHNFLIFCGIHSSFHSHFSCAHSCHTTTSMLNSWQGILPYKGFTIFVPKDTLFGSGEKVVVNFVYVSPKHIVPKGFRLPNAFFCILQLILCCNHTKGFFLATLSLLFKICCIIVLWTARPVPAIHFCRSFAGMFGFFPAFLTRSRDHSIWTFFQTLPWLPLFHLSSIL